MKKMIWIVLCAAFIFPSCEKISGEGPVVSETRPITGFTGINAGIAGNLFFTPDSAFKVEIAAQQNILDVIETSVSNGVLQVGFRYDKHIGRHKPVTVRVSAPDINSLGLSGSGNIRVTAPFHPANIQLRISGSGAILIPGLVTDNINATISGSGNIKADSGSCNKASLDISGSGNIDLLNINAARVTVHTSGSGNARVNAAEVLEVHVSGSGDVYYKGNPQVITSISGSGKVRPW